MFFIVVVAHSLKDNCLSIPRFEFFRATCPLRIGYYVYCVKYVVL
jgi:hypothetical protein